MAILASPKKRSNRPITEITCRRLEGFILDNLQDGYQAEEKNTLIRITRSDRLRVARIFLYNEEILRLAISDNKASSLTVSFTSFFDAYGQPTTTTCERINGLLDCLSHFDVIPFGVRLFRDQEYHLTYLGKGDEKVAVGNGLYTSVYITPNPNRLIFAGYTSKIDSDARVAE